MQNHRPALVFVVGLALCSLFAVAAGAGTRAWYRFEESSGVPGSPGGTIAHLTDYSGSGNHSQAIIGTSNATFDANVFNAEVSEGSAPGATVSANDFSMTLPDGSDRAWDIGDGTGKFVSQDATLEFWVDLSSLPPPTYGTTRTVALYSRGGPGHIFQMGLLDGIGSREVVAKVTPIGVGTYGARNGWQLQYGITGLTGWHHIAFVMIQGVSAEFYLDHEAMGGKGAGEPFTNNPATIDDIHNTYHPSGIKTTFGAYDVQGTPGVYNLYDTFRGTIDEFRWSDVALTPDQFLSLPAPAPATGGLVLVGSALVAWRCRRRKRL